VQSCRPSGPHTPPAYAFNLERLSAPIDMLNEGALSVRLPTVPNGPSASSVPASHAETIGISHEISDKGWFRRGIA